MGERPRPNTEADRRVAQRLARQYTARGFDDLEEVPRWLEGLHIVAEDKARALNEIAREARDLIAGRVAAIRSGEYGKLVANYLKIEAVLKKFDLAGLTEYSVKRADDLEDLRREERQVLQARK